MITARVLDPSEWPPVSESGSDGGVLPRIDPSRVSIVSVEKDGRQVGRLGVYTVTYWEGLWIDPQERKNPGVIRALLSAAVKLPRTKEDQWILAAAERPETQEFIERIAGQPIPAKYYVIPVGGDVWEQR
jgi:hypothetical protein